MVSGEEVPPNLKRNLKTSFELFEKDQYIAF